jgi:hypothetical protein
MVPVNAERITIGQRLYEKINDDERFRLRRIVDEASEMLRQSGLVVCPGVAEGDPAEALTQEARVWKADAIFIGAWWFGTHGAAAVGECFFRDSRSCGVHGRGCASQLM